MNFQEETLPHTHPPAKWLRSIFDYEINMHIATNLPSSLQPLLTTTLAHLYPEKQQLLLTKFCLPCTTPCLRGSPCKPGWPPNQEQRHHRRLLAHCWGW